MPPPATASAPSAMMTIPQIGKPPPESDFVAGSFTALITPPGMVGLGDPAPGEPAGIVPGRCVGAAPAAPLAGVRVPLAPVLLSPVEPTGVAVRGGVGVAVGIGTGVTLPNVISTRTSPALHLAVCVAKRSPILRRTAVPSLPQPATCSAESTVT